MSQTHQATPLSANSVPEDESVPKTVNGVARRKAKSSVELDSVAAIKRAVMGLLARREHSRRELLRKIGSKVDNQDLLDQALDQLEQDGYLSDDRFAAAYVRSRKNKGFGPVRIASELRERGIGESLIAECLYTPEIDWFEIALAVKMKKFGSSLAIDIKQKAKQSRFLIQRGFNSDQCQHAVSE